MGLLKCMLLGFGIMLVLLAADPPGQSAGKVEDTAASEPGRHSLKDSDRKIFDMESVSIDETGLREFMITEYFQITGFSYGKTIHILYSYLQRLLGVEGPDHYRGGQRLVNWSPQRERAYGHPRFLRGPTWWTLTARLGNGTNCDFDVVVSMSKDRTELNWLVDMNRNHDFSDDRVLTQPKHLFW